jgi:hypothetical protein
VNHKSYNNEISFVIHTTPVYNLLCIFSPLFTTVRPEDGQARPKHVVTFDNKIQNQDSCVFRQIPPPSFDVSVCVYYQITTIVRAYENNILSNNLIPV